MKAIEHLRTALFVLGPSTLAVAANAGDAAHEHVAQPTEEIVVYGTPAELALDVGTLRIDSKENASVIASSVRDALAKSSAEPRVANAPASERG